MARTLRSSLLFATLAAIAAPGLAAASPCTPRVERFTIKFGGATSRAEILRPPVARPRAIMVLIHGSDVADLDSSVVDAKGAVIATPLRDVATALACGGVATIRYDKRFVTGAATVDRDAFAKLRLQDLLADAVTALDVARTRRDLGLLPQGVFGWSEGTTVAAALAAQRPAIRIVVLQAPVLTSFAQKLPEDYPRVGAPYLARFATNGALDADAIARATAGPGGIIAQIYVGMFRGFAPGERINPLLDSNHDGRIALTEAQPIIRGWFADDVNGGLGMYASSVALPGVRAQLPKIRARVLILQGTDDGAIDPADARALGAERRPNVTVRLYPGLGHTLGPSPSPIEDHFLPTAPAPLRDMVRWVTAQLR